MSITIYGLVAFALIVVGVALVIRGRPWSWRLAGAGFAAFGLTMLYNLTRTVLVPM